MRRGTRHAKVSVNSRLLRSQSEPSSHLKSSALNMHAASTHVSVSKVPQHFTEVEISSLETADLSILSTIKPASLPVPVTGMQFMVCPSQHACDLSAPTLRGKLGCRTFVWLLSGSFQNRQCWPWGDTNGPVFTPPCLGDSGQMMESLLATASPNLHLQGASMLNKRLVSLWILWLSADPPHSRGSHTDPLCSPGARSHRSITSAGHCGPPHSPRGFGHPPF